MPAARRLVVLSLGLWLAMLLVLLLGSATMLALDTVTLGDMRWIGTDADVTAVVVDRLAVFVTLALVTAGVMARAWVQSRPRSTEALDAGAAAPAVQAALLRIVAGSALVLTIASAVAAVSLARALG